MSKIVVVGCGNMGGAITAAFMNKGHEVTIVDPNREGVQKYIDQGAKYANSLDEVEDYKFALFNLPSKEIVMSVLDHLKEGALEGKAIVNTTTATPTDCTEMCEYMVKLGARCLDSKIECYPPEIGTEYGILTYCGNEALFNEIQEDLTAISPQPWYLGTSYASSSVIDIAAIEVQYAYRYSIMEGVGLAIKNHANIEAFLQMVEAGTPGILEVTRRQLNKAFIEHQYDDTFEESSEASIEVDYHGLNQVKKAFEQSGMRTDFNRQMISLYKEAIDDGLATKEDVAIMHEILK